MMKNKQLLLDALEFARRSAAGEKILINGIKSEWDQGAYAAVTHDEPGNLHTCGTSFCIAGYIVTQHPNYEAELVEGRYGVYLHAKINGETISNYGNIAITMLGVEPHSVEGDNFWRLFDGMNTLEDVERIGAEILEGNTMNRTETSIQLLDKLDAARAAGTQGEWWNDQHAFGDGQVVMANGLRRAHLPHSALVTDDAENAALIVLAVNTLPQLTDAIRAVLTYCDDVDSVYRSPNTEVIRDRIAAALASTEAAS